MIFAHALGGGANLALPTWMFAYCGGAAAVISSFAVRLLWPRPRLARAATGRPIRWAGPVGVRRVRVIGRVVGVAVLAGTLYAGWFGNANAVSNITPLVTYVAFWLAIQLASAVLGDVWRVLDPIDTLAAGVERVRRRPAAGDGPEWTAALGLGAFCFVELAYHHPSSPRVLANFIALYVAAHLVGVWRWGRGWLRRGEGFSAFFGLLGGIGILFRRDDGGLGVRAPLSGLAASTPTPTALALLCIALGANGFDGLSRTAFWVDISGTRIGWGLTLVDTFGMLWVIGIVAVAYIGCTRVAARLVERDPASLALPFSAALVPLAVTFTLAHFTGFAIFQAQSLIVQLSDPLGRGADWFGTASWHANDQLVSANAISWIQAGLVMAGLIGAVIVAHDRSVRELGTRASTRPQYAILGLLVAYTVGGLALLLGS